MIYHFPYNIILNKNNMLARKDTTSKEIPEFCCLFGRQACLLTNRAALHTPKADAAARRPRHSCEPVQTEVSYTGIYNVVCGKQTD